MRSNASLRSMSFLAIDKLKRELSSLLFPLSIYFISVTYYLNEPLPSTYFTKLYKSFNCLPTGCIMARENNSVWSEKEILEFLGQPDNHEDAQEIIELNGELMLVDNAVVEE